MEDNLSHPLALALSKVAEKTKDRKCPFCDNNQWLFEQDKNAGPEVPKMSVLPLDELSPEKPDSIVVLTLTCSNCGFVRLHNALTVLNNDGAKGNG